MTRRKKLTKEDCEQIAKLINEGYEIKDFAKKYRAHRSTISTIEVKHFTNREKSHFKSKTK